MTDLIAELRARAKASGGDKLLEEAAAALEAARKDAARLAFLALASEPIPEGFVGDEYNIYDYACDCAEENGRDEPNDEDYINGMRRMIDAAIDRARGSALDELRAALAAKQQGGAS